MITAAVALRCLRGGRASSALRACNAAACCPSACADAAFRTQSISTAATVQFGALAGSRLPSQDSQAATPAGADVEQMAADRLAAWIQSLYPQPAQLVPSRIADRGG